MKTYLVLIGLILTFTTSQANSTIIDFSPDNFLFPNTLSDQGGFTFGDNRLGVEYVDTLFGFSGDINDFMPLRSSFSAISKEGAQVSATLAYDWEASFISVPTDRPDLFPQPSLHFGFSFGSGGGGGTLTPGDFISGHEITKIFAGATISLLSDISSANSPYHVEFRLFNIREISEPPILALMLLGLVGLLGLQRRINTNNMRKHHNVKKMVSTISIAVFSLSMLSTAHAALETRLGGLAVYDTDLDITWLADANAGAGSSFDDDPTLLQSNSTTDGRMTWNSAKAWAASLNVEGITGWRLPSALNADGSGPCGQFNCNGSEMGHLFYNVLGGTAGNSILDSSDLDLALFSNVKAFFYWYGTPGHVQNTAWSFRFHEGLQLQDSRTLDWHAWAVHDGDVGKITAVSEPATAILIGLGLMSLLSTRKNLGTAHTC